MPGRRCGCFLALALAFAIKVPMWPLHSWLPDAHVEAPTAGSVILAGVLLKMGAYGFLRFNLPLFPQAPCKLAPWMAGLAVIGILYGAIVAFRQKDVKKLVAYSSVSHLGFVMLGIFCAHPAGHCRGHFADGQPRPEHRRALPDGRHALRTPPHPRVGCLWRPVEGDAGPRRPGSDRHPFLGGPARLERLCG